MSRAGWEMYTVNARVLWGRNPFPPPTRADYAEDVARAAEGVARNGRILGLYGWLTPEERATICDYAARTAVPWALRALAAFRTGACPKTEAGLGPAFARTPEAALLEWLRHLTEADYREQYAAIGRRLSLAARDWLREVRAARQAQRHWRGLGSE
jgi:hypothetical protein